MELLVMPSQVEILTHPLIQHKLSVMRDKNTPSGVFRALVEDLSFLMGYEILRSLPLTQKQIETPMMPMQAPVIENHSVALVSILRAGTGMLTGLLRLLPEAHVGHVGLYRDPNTYEAVEYYYKMPKQMPEKHTIVVDPMLATGHSAAAAMAKVVEEHPKSIQFACVLAAPEGIEYFQKHHPAIPIFTAAIDEKLNDKKYIMPGLGDAGDRMFGTV